MLLPDGAHVGLTVCKVADRGSRDFGHFPSQPYVATIDLDGHNLTQLAPGAMPCWSPDGATILFTAVTVTTPAAPPTRARRD